MRAVRGLFALGLTGCACACATHQVAPLPLLHVSASGCSSAPALARAVPLAYDPSKDDNGTSTDITAASPCFRDAAGASLYLAYHLPSSSASYVVRVDSVPEEETLLALRVLLYGANGTLEREFAGREIVFRGGDLSVIFRSHHRDRYLVVASDPAAIGRKVSHVQDATGAIPVAAYPYYFTLHSGTDATVSRTLSENGHITISLDPLAAK